jgi:hypothetical protein
MQSATVALPQWNKAKIGKGDHMTDYEDVRKKAFDGLNRPVIRTKLYCTTCGVEKMKDMFTTSASRIAYCETCRKDTGWRRVKKEDDI